MKGHWIFVLLCLFSTVGQLQLVLGSIFPESQNPPSSPIQIVSTQQEHVQMPLPNLDPISEVTIVREATINTRDLQVEHAEEKVMESGQKAAVLLPAVITINPGQKPAVNEILTIKNNEETKNASSSTNNN